MTQNESGDGDDDLARVFDLAGGGSDVDALLSAARAEVVSERPLSGDPDGDALVARVTQALPLPHPLLRITLAVLASAQLVLVLPWLVDADPFGLLGVSAPSHLTRDGALGLAVAVAGILGAWRPQWALPCLALASAAVIAQAVAGLVDGSTRSNGGSELVHVPSVVITCLIGFCTVRLEALAPRR